MHNSTAENFQRGHVQLELVYMCSFSLAMNCSHLLSENSQIPSYSWNKISLYSLVPMQALPSPQQKINTFVFFVGARGEPGNKVNILLAVAILCIHCTSCIKCHEINQKKKKHFSNCLTWYMLSKRAVAKNKFLFSRLCMARPSSHQLFYF